MKQEELPFAPLGIPGEFQVPDGQIGVALDVDFGLHQWFQRRLLPPKDEVVRPRNALQGAIFVHPQNDRVIQASLALNHRTATAAASEDLYPGGLAGFQIHFQRGLIGITHHHKRGARLPKPQYFVLPTFFAKVNQGLVAGQIVGGSRQC